MSEPRGSHRAVPVRPRYGRLTALAVSLAVTAIAVLGSFGILPFSDGDGAAAQQDNGPATADIGAAVVPPSDDASPSATDSQSTGASSADDTKTDTKTETETETDTEATVPAGSGDGRRVVFSQSRQRVWLIGQNDKVQRTYRVSGSVYDNLDPGSYQVYSRSEQAWGIDDSGTMKYFVRFAQGDNAAIGFHDIPIADGKPVQTKAQLGTPLSHGCIRQKEADAIALWAFAPIGTDVVVTA